MPDRLDVRAACLFMTADPQWRRKIFVVGLVLMLPVVGWAMVLGYRKMVVDRLLAGAEPLLPEWRSNLATCLAEGIRCCAVIAVWLLPATLFAGWAIRSAGLASEIPWLPLLGILLVFPIFSPLALPFVVGYATVAPDAPMSPALAAGIVGLYAALVFMIPLGFLRVSATGRYLSAFDVAECLKFLARNPTRFAEAWWHSSIISLIGHFCIPFSAWGVVWAYLGIVYCFNEVLCRDTTRAESAGAKSWYPRIAGWSRDQPEGKPATIVQQRIALDGAQFRTASVVGYEVPLPAILEGSR